jgi:hypothetical protein
MTSLILALCNFAVKPKNVLKETDKDDVVDLKFGSEK